MLKNFEEKNVKIVITILSVVIAVLVGLLNWVLPKPEVIPSFTQFQPLLHAILNGSVALFLALGLYFIKNGQKEKHQKVMFLSFVFSSLFLVSYVVYHSLAPETRYGGEGLDKTFYLILLATHIIISAFIMPFILMTFYYAWTDKYIKHRKLAKIVWPFWFYVAVTGVIIYFMIAPYYPWNI